MPNRWLSNTSPREPPGAGVFPAKVGVEKSLDVIRGPAAKEQKQCEMLGMLVTLLRVLLAGTGPAWPGTC